MNSNVVKRIEWIDIGKAMAIVFVIIAHTMPGNGIAKAISSFVIPFFFMVSAITFKFSTDKAIFCSKMKKTFIHLLTPAFVMIFISMILYIIMNYDTIDSQYFKEQFLTILYASGNKVIGKHRNINPIGVPWFFFALAFSRTLLDFIGLIFNKKILPFIVCLISIAGVIISKYVWLPFSFDVVLALMPFLYIGNQLKKINFESKPLLYFSIFFVLWAILFFFIFYVTRSYYEAAGRRYPLFPLCYICAFFGSLALGYFCQILSKSKFLSVPFKFIGRNSLYFLCIHILDFSFMSAWRLTPYNYYNSVIRISEDLAAFAILMLVIKYIRKYKENKTS